MKLCLTTCNIRFDNPADGINSWSHRRIFLAETLLMNSPDILATQEGRLGQLKDLESLLKDYEILDSHRAWISERMYPTLFIKKEFFEIMESGDVWLSETPDVPGSCSFESTFPRLMTWAKIKIKATKENLLIINTHLDHVKRSTRVCQARVLTTAIKNLLKDNEMLFIMGDFNDSPDSDVRKVFEEDLNHLQDAWALKNTFEESSHHSFKGKVSNGSRIDWILADKKVQIDSCQMDKTSKNNHYPTDHFPIVCKISS